MIMSTSAIYARVSTKKQETEMQLTDLRGFVSRTGVESIEYIETASSQKHRPVFEQMMADARLHRFDTVLVWKVDRIARSMKQFVDTVLELDRLGICFRAITQNISSDQKDPMGKFVLGLFGLLAEMEHAMIVERVRAGVAEAQRQGKHCGRPKRVFRRDQALEMRTAGASWRKIAEELGVPASTVRLAIEVGLAGSADVNQG
jgi:DNA invertase Pin-like site-specific DNA recombinase